MLDRHEIRPSHHIGVLKVYRTPIVAGAALLVLLAVWTVGEIRGQRQRHRTELARFADGLFLAMDVSRADNPPQHPPGPVGFGPPPRGAASGMLPVLENLVHASPRLLGAAVLRGGEVVVSVGAVPGALRVDLPHGARFDQHTATFWKPLPVPTRAELSDFRGRRNNLPPPDAPIAVLVLDSTVPPDLASRNRRSIAVQTGLALLGLIALLTAWVQRVRRRNIALELEAEHHRAAHLEELSLAASGLAHETKNPLGIIRGLAQHIAQSPELSDDRREQAAQIVDEADRAVVRLGDFISYARVSQPKIEPVKIREVFHRTLTVLGTDLEVQGVQTRVDSPEVTVAADRDMLLRVLLNLMLNSLEACKRGNTVHLLFSATGHSGQLEVSDDGPGIDRELLARVTKPYVSGRPDGHGLGLAIIRRIVEQHGWTLAVESEPGHGTRVIIDGIHIMGSSEEGS